MIAGTTTTMLRSGVARGCGLQPIILRSVACPYSTLTVAPFAVRSKIAMADNIKSFSPRSTSPIAKAATIPLAASISFRSQQPPTAQRHASTSSSSTTTRTSTHDQDAAAAAQAAAAASQKAAANPDMPPLDWNTFFKLRKTRRWWQLSFSVIMSLGGGTAGGMFLAGGGADLVTGQVPLDPIVTLGLMTFAFAALGWLLGPSIGSQIFYMFNSKFRAPMHLKEGQFFARIKKNRVDPSNSSAGNPVPDFYGEKISSVAGYRQWLKDQRAYNKKRTTFV